MHGAGVEVGPPEMPGRCQPSTFRKKIQVSPCKKCTSGGAHAVFRRLSFFSCAFGCGASKGAMGTLRRMPGPGPWRAVAAFKAAELGLLARYKSVPEGNTGIIAVDFTSPVSTYIKDCQIKYQTYYDFCVYHRSGSNRLRLRTASAVQA